jgi:FAD/FMN-containing dehydrogenase/Fe-S oxidoreductase
VTISAQQQATLTGSNCKLAFDNLTRQIYATDASHYQLEPIGVAFPQGTRQACAIVEAAANAGIAITPRGAGTSLTGGAIGEGLVIDFARFNRHISDLDMERRTVRVGPGVVLDQLNKFLHPHGLCFGPDVATSSRATLGGMIANNSSGAHTRIYGTTADHIESLDVILADGNLVTIGARHDTLRKQRELVENLVYFHALEINEAFPPGLLKRWPGYGLERCARFPNDLTQLLSGSEGTLAAIISAELKVVPLPEQKGLGLIFFGSVADAMQATVELLDLEPAAIENLDHVLLDQTRDQVQFRAAREFLELDHQSCQSLLAVEFFEDVGDRLSALLKRKLGLRTLIAQSQAEADMVWSLRKAGLNLLTGRRGPAKPVTCIEDAAVRPKDLPAYIAALEGIIGRMGLQASFYGHAAAGLLHVRPVLDLHSAEDLVKFRHLASEVSSLVKQFKGSLAAEHGVGIARTEFMTEQLGESLLGVMREIKASFDPHNVFNPGKIFPDGRFLIDTDLRQGASNQLALPFAPVLAFAARDGNFTANLEQCNGCGGCIKLAPTMCPTYIATGDEYMSTRGRANAIRAALEHRGLENTDALASPEMEAALSNCLACRACTSECPSNVNLSLLKAELQHAQICHHGMSMRQRLFSYVDVLGRLGCVAPGSANQLLDSLVVRSFLSKLWGIAWQRPLPHYTKQRFDRWFARRPTRGSAQRGRVILWDDTFVRYHEPHIGIAAVKVLEALGFDVTLVKGRRCCGRPAFSQGHLKRAKALGEHNLRLLQTEVDQVPILFLEPSCYSMFVEDYRELGLTGTEDLAQRCFLFERFIEDMLAHDPHSLIFNTKAMKVIIHAHCHTKAMGSTNWMKRLAERLPGRTVTLLNTGCCGMAGAFGALQEKYELSLKVAEPLTQEIRGQPYGTVVVASGTSCRHQIDHLAPIRSRHMAELLADSLVSHE